MPSDSHDLDIRRTRFLVVGSGVAGLWTAIHLARHGPTLVITKRRADDCTTTYAQGGIAVAVCPQDSPACHARDTIAAGAGLCDEAAVRVLTSEGPARVEELIQLGATFDRFDGRLHCRMEAAHTRRRIIHARGDATGAEVERALLTAAAAAEDLAIAEFVQAMALLTHDGAVVGVDALDARTGRRLRIVADATVLATGGFSAVYQFTTGPDVAIGDGMVLAYRAGAVLMDMEFVQFHPTALCTSQTPAPLVSEAVRGEGAILLNAAGEAFMARYHPMADLAPRDIVSRAEFMEMQRLGADHCLLDMRPIPRDRLTHGFPHVLASIRQHGFDPLVEPVPIRPVAHYTMGGIATDLHARASLQRLYAVGECSCTGVHGANRLASNSLLEGLVFGSRAAAAAADEPALLPAAEAHARRSPPASYLVADASAADDVPSLMWTRVGIIRDRGALQEAVDALGQRIGALKPAPPGGPEALAGADAANMLLVCWLAAQAAIAREESRGSHYRRDHPEPSSQWECHLAMQVGPDLQPRFTTRPVQAAPAAS